MSDWYGNRSNETYTYRRVKWPQWSESEDYGNIVGGSVELSALSDLRASGSFNFFGDAAPDPNDLVRIYYSFEDDNGEREQVAIATMFVEYSNVTFQADYTGSTCNGLVASGSVQLSSTLKPLLDKTYGMPYTVQAGTNCVEHAKSLIEGLGLICVSDYSDYELASDHTFEPDDKYSTICNWLLNAAGFNSMMPDAYGVINLTKYVAPDAMAPRVTFANDERSIMLPQVVETNDWQKTANVVRAYYETDTLAMYAVAKNMSGTKASLASRGNREITLFENVSELEDGTSQEMLDNLMAHALKKLRDNSSEIEHVRLNHAYIPLTANDAVRINYDTKTWQGSVTNMSIELQPGTECQTEIRRYLDNSMEVQATGDIIYEVEDE